MLNQCLLTPLYAVCLYILYIKLNIFFFQVNMISTLAIIVVEFGAKLLNSDRIIKEMERNKRSLRLSIIALQQKLVLTYMLVSVTCQNFGLLTENVDEKRSTEPHFISH